MSDKTMENKKISMLCEFTDRKLENDYFTQDMHKSIRYIKPVVLAFGVLYLLFAIPDYFVIGRKLAFYQILESRLVFFCVVMAVYVLLHKIKNYIVIAYMITFTEIFAIISFMITLVKFDQPNYLIQAFGIMVLVLAMFLVPNKWINTVVAVAIALISFFVLTAKYMSYVPPAEYYAGVIYLQVITLLSAISSYRNSYLKRKQYASSLELQRLSETDTLTGIYNRGRFDYDIAKWVDMAKRYKIPLTLVMFDFDNFKKINDTFGHVVGDEILVDITDIINDVVRKTDIFARWGGDEFMLLLPNTDLAEALELIERIRAAMDKYRHKKADKVRCSFGVAELKESDNSGSLLNKVDKYLYQAKRNGRDGVMS